MSTCGVYYLPLQTRDTLLAKCVIAPVKALFSSAAYIQSFEGMSLEDSQALAMELYVYQTQEKFQYRHQWEKDMLLIWDNRSLLHSATGGFDGYDRLLHRVTIADTQW